MGPLLMLNLWQKKRPKMRTRNYDWYDTKKCIPIYGIQILVWTPDAGNTWVNAAENGQALLFENEQQRDTKRKELSKIPAPKNPKVLNSIQ